MKLLYKKSRAASTSALRYAAHAIPSPSVKPVCSLCAGLPEICNRHLINAEHTAFKAPPTRDTDAVTFPTLPSSSTCVVHPAAVPWPVRCARAPALVLVPAMHVGHNFCNAWQGGVARAHIQEGHPGSAGNEVLHGHAVLSLQGPADTK